MSLADTTYQLWRCDDNRPHKKERREPVYMMRYKDKGKK